MTNKDIARKFKLCGQLMELYGENSFKSKALINAAFRIEKLPFTAENSDFNTLSESPNIGKSSAEKIVQIISKGTFPDLERLISKTPKGILEMLSIKGLGPKKIQIIWNDLEIETIGELYYACNENRLIKAKGFGLKTQKDIKKAIEFSFASKGWHLYSKIITPTDELINSLAKQLKDYRIEITGELRRKSEILEAAELITNCGKDDLQQVLQSLGYCLEENTNANYINFKDVNEIPFKIWLTNSQDFSKDLLLTTGSSKHIENLQKLGEIQALSTEKEIYANLGLAYIEPELREGYNEIQLASNNNLPILIEYKDLKGTIHNHSTYSDGVHTLKEMAVFVRDELKLTYLGISDHSKTAVYAQGLSVEKLYLQWAEIDELNKELAPFKIFKGIESDILSDGSLDYPDEILEKFDFVVASIHSVLKMDKERATNRLLKAIENPFTTILGHPTGRLLLARAGYPIDYEKIIDACAANEVIIEINANPQRLDLDWRWHQYALEKGVLLSINPDAHRTEGFNDMKYGINIARKGGLSANRCFNAFTETEVTEYLNNRKNKRNNH